MLSGHLGSAAGVSHGLSPRICLAGAWAFGLPWLGGGEWVASRDLLTEPNIRVWLPLWLSTCNRFLPSRKSLSGNVEETEVLYSLPFTRAFGNRWVWKYPPKRMPPHCPLGCSQVVPTTAGWIPSHAAAIAASWIPAGNGGLGRREERKVAPLVFTGSNTMSPWMTGRRFLLMSLYKKNVQGEPCLFAE